MKNLLLLCFLFVSCSLIAQNTAKADQTTTRSAQKPGIDFFHGSWDDVRQAASDEGKFIMVDAFTTWCGPCKKMSRETFTDQKVGDFFNKHFINYKFDMEKGEGPAFARTYGIRSYPTVVFFDVNTKEEGRFSGFRNPQQFLTEAKKILADQQLLTELQEKFIAGQRNPEFLHKYINQLQYAGKSTKEASQAFMEQYTTDELLGEENMQIAFDDLRDWDSPFYAFVNENKAAFETQFGADVLSTQIRDTGIAYYLKSEKTENETDVQRAVELVNSVEFEGKELLVFKMAMRQHLRTENWKEYEKTAKAYLEKFEIKDAGLLNNIAWNFHQHVGSKKNLVLAEDWARKSIAIKSDYHNNDTLAAILFKRGKKAEAKTVAENAIALAQKRGIDATSTKELLEKIGS